MRHGAARAGRAVLVSLCGILTVCLVLHHQAGNGGRYDQIMEVLALEHWHEAGQFPPPGGAPVPGDGRLIYGLIYSFFRLTGVEPYLGAECVSVTVRTAGFCGFYLAARRLLDLMPGRATLAAVVAFILGSSALMQASHAQLVSLAFAPVVAVLLQGTAEALRTAHRAQAVACGVPATCLYAVWLLTAAYTACVFLILLVLAALAYLALTRRAGLRAAIEFTRGGSGAVQTPRYPIS